MNDPLDGWVAGMDFARQSRFPQFEDKTALPDGPVTRAWLDGFAAGVLTCYEGPDADEVKVLCKRLRDP